MNNDCSICCEKIINNAYSLPCSHTFHKNCIQRWFQEKKNCPYCRLDIDVILNEHVAEDERIRVRDRLFSDLKKDTFYTMCAGIEYFANSIAPGFFPQGWSLEVGTKIENGELDDFFSKLTEGGNDPQLNLISEIACRSMLNKISQD